MDFEFFEALSANEARDYLTRFRQVVETEIAATLEQAQKDSVPADFSLASLPSFFTWLASHITVLRVSPPPDLPDWLLKSIENDSGGLLDFDERSRPLTLRAGYYLGQSFVASVDKLKWSIGRPDRAEANQPVVTGFSTDVDLPPLLVAENLLLGAEEPGFSTRLDTAISTWIKAI